MNRRSIWIGVAVLTAAIVFSISPYGLAQGPEPPEGPESTSETGGVSDDQPLEVLPESEDSEPIVPVPDSTDALVGSSFTYQGMLKNNGVPVDVYCDFIWDIFAASSGGDPLATDDDPNVLVANGLFTAVVDVPATVFDGNARFLEIRVRCPAGSAVDYALLTPRQELEATPYALGLHLPFYHETSNVGTAIFSISNTSSATTYASIQGSSAGGDGVRGLSTGAGSADNGVYGETNSTSASDAGVKGVSTTAAAGGYFSNTGSGAALFANGDAKQSLAGDGLVKAGVYVSCEVTDSIIYRSFNNVNATAITVLDGGSPGQCTVDFGFDVSSRYVTALAYGSGVARIVTFDFGAATDRLDFFRFDENGAGLDGGIMILVY